MGDIPGFEPFRFAGDYRDLMHTVITKRLNRALCRYLPLLVLFPLRTVNQKSLLIGSLVISSSTRNRAVGGGRRLLEA